MTKIVIGLAPTRRSIFSTPDTVKLVDLTRKRLRELNVEFVGIDDIAEDGLLHSEEDHIKTVEKFEVAKVDGLFFPHGSFGTEYEVARLAKELNVPVFLWGPRDERPDENGIHLRDSRCGLFATGKVFRRFQVPFIYMTSCRLEDAESERGVRDFLAVCNVMKVFRSTRILQIGPRPFDFWSTMCNEDELLEKLNIQLSPIPMPELTCGVRRALEEKTEVAEVVAYCREHFNIAIKNNELEHVVASKVATKRLTVKYGHNVIAIQCWNALRGELGTMPCAASSLLNEEGIPVVCETDTHGTITAIMAEAAGMDEAKTFFTDWTVRHSDNENGELLQHCGPWSLPVAKEKPSIGYPLAFDHPGAVEAPAKDGEMTLCRSDGDNGEYSLSLENVRGVKSPYTKGTYVWVEMENLKRLGAKIVEEPYIHHCVEIHEDVMPVLYEACKYLGIKPDLYDPVEEQVKTYLYGE